MRGNDIHSRAARRVRVDHRSTATDEFDHRILCDGVHDDVVEDDQLAQLEDAIATVEDVRDERRRELGDTDDYDARVESDTASAALQLHDVVDQRVMEICAERCRAVLVDGDEWVEEGWEDASEVEAAKREATNWLLEHPETCKRLWGQRSPTMSTLEVRG
ncbi:hypothetical protein C5B90_19200 [Haloferax sp. Atlit-12N]|uniref:hypothetical protein n=1 Tax=Haloferax sp. Atlit-12N TaxID=2077203 RepID=UPI000E225C52|nr:hypothetical protein [Haloferax sp. Atlit-12N]RDZ61401.1 hypothetical protein C5B90_19200 [Haloferax sp. Atlit-12N]